MEQEIVVKGYGRSQALPDRAVLQVGIEAEAANGEQAYGEAARLAGRVDEVLAGRADAIVRTVTSALVVHPRTRWKRGETVRTGWRAARGSMVEVSDFSLLGELIAELTAAGGAVSGPSWQLDEANVAYRQARQAAAVDARRRAEDYTEALQVSLGAVAWIAEPGLRIGGERIRSLREFPEPGGAGMAEEPNEIIDMTPAKITVDAAVEVGFSVASHP